MSKTIRQTFNLCSQQVLSNCYSFIAEHYQQQEGNLKLMATVELIDGDKARSLSQNALYWSWVGYLSDKLGDTKDDLHARHKWRFLRPIFVRDNREFAEMMLSVDEYQAHATKEEFAVMAKGISRLISTTKATSKQMAEFMKNMDMFYYSEGYALPKPDDYAWITGANDADNE